MDYTCTSSLPSHLYHSISCDGHIVPPPDSVNNNTVNISDGQIVYQQSLHVDYHKCTAVLIWSNRISSVENTITFSKCLYIYID